MPLATGHFTLLSENFFELISGSVTCVTPARVKLLVRNTVFGDAAGGIAEIQYV